MNVFLEVQSRGVPTTTIRRVASKAVHLETSFYLACRQKKVALHPTDLRSTSAGHPAGPEM
jgi:hypothetical protein